MNINIRQKDCKFIVKEAERKVICVLDVRPTIVYDFLSSSPDSPFYFTIDYSDKDNYLKSSYVGVATCAPEDTFDVETGKLVAYAKAKSKFCSAFMRSVDRLVKELDAKIDDAIEAVDNLADNWYINLDTIRKRINQLT